MKEIVFDEEARRCVSLMALCATPSPIDSFREFLTGFHKRKLKRTEAAKKNALERQKQERRETRNEVESGIIRQAKVDCSSATPRTP